jgi:YbbR-like protein
MSSPDKYSIFFKSERAVLVLCIGIAMIFWLLTRLSQTFKTTQECSLHYQLPEGYILASEAPNKLVVSMEGVGWDLMSNYFNKEEGSLTLQLSNSPRQMYNSAQLINKLTSTRSSIDVIGLNLDLLELFVEEKMIKRVPVVLSPSLTLHPQYQLSGLPIIHPDSVWLSGPSSMIDTIVEWPTTAVSLTEIDKDINLSVPLKKAPGNYLSVEPEAVQLVIRSEQLTEKSFFISVQVKNAQDSIKIFPNNIKVSCILGMSQFEQVKASDFMLEVDMSGVASKTENNTLPVILTRQPENIRAVHLSHQSVEFFYGGKT